MRRVYEAPEMEITVFSLNTSVLAAASNSGTEFTVGGTDVNEEIDPF